MTGLSRNRLWLLAVFMAVEWLQSQMYWSSTQEKIAFLRCQHTFDWLSCTLVYLVIVVEGTRAG